MSIKIINKEDDEILFFKKWDEYIKNKKVSSRYLPINIKHNFLFLKNLVCDKSFVYLIDNKPAACAFLPLLKINGVNSISFNGEYLDAPLADETVMKDVYLLIDEIAQQCSVEKIKFSLDPLMNYNYNYLQKFGYFDASILTYIIDLKVHDLLKSCRKGHRCDIKKTLNDKNFKIIADDNKSCSKDRFDDYVKLHHKCAGRITRPQETFDWQFKKIKNGSAALFGLAYKNKMIAYSYFEFNNDKALYYSTSDDPDYHFKTYHSLLFKAMEYLKEKGISFIDTSQPSCPSPQFDYYPDKKQLNIALFKRGFGGGYKINFRGIKYFSKEAFKNDAKNFIDNYSKSFTDFF